MSGFMIAVLAAGVCLLLLGGSPRLYLLRQSFISLAIGMAYLVSLLFPKPLWFFVGRYMLTGNNPQNVACYNGYWSYPFFRSAMRFMSLMWSVLTLLSVAIHIVLVLTLPIAVLIIIDSVIAFVTMAVLLGWTGWYVRDLMRKLEQAQRNQEQSFALQIP